MAEHTPKFEIQDIDSYENEEEQIFSHQALVMKAMKRCLELGALELHEGANVREVVNDKFVIIHKPNERKQFINSIKVLKSLMICDFDDKAREKFTVIKKAFGESKDKLLKEQFEFYKGMSDIGKNNLGVYAIHREVFSEKLPFLEKFKEEELDYYRDIFEELNLLTQRLDFYKSFDVIA